MEGGLEKGFEKGFELGVHAGLHYLGEHFVPEFVVPRISGFLGEKLAGQIASTAPGVGASAALLFGVLAPTALADGTMPKLPPTLPSLPSLPKETQREPQRLQKH